MNIVVQGTKSFSDYSVFMRAMAVAMSSIGNDKEFNVYTVGPVNINNFTAEFCNKVEQSLKDRGIKIRFYRVPAITIEEDLSNYDWFGFFCNPGERPGHVFLTAQATDMETAIFRY